MNTQKEPRHIYDIAADIMKEWKNPYFAAHPYLMAMLTLRDKDDRLFSDSATSIVTYFLSNASTFRGGNAKALKQELKDAIK
jgi:hypothetical protein